MLRFEFSRKDEGEPSGFDLGDISVLGDRMATSDGHAPSQSVMIYLALVDLVLGVSRLCRSNRPGVFRFVGADSSFTLVFSRTKRGAVEIVGSNGVIVARTAPEAVLAALREGLERFLRAGNKLVSTDPVAEDLSVALAELFRAGEA